MNNKKCGLCNKELPGNQQTSLCSDCLRHADCCVGLEKMDGA